MAGVIFDFNGTLFQDSDKHEEAWQIFAKKHIGRSLSEADYDNHVHGRNNDLILEYFFSEHLTQVQKDAYALEKEAIYRKLCREDPMSLCLVMGTTAYFNWLVDEQIPRTIATAAPKENVDFYFDVFQLDRWFDYRKVVFDDGTLQSKPSPDPYIKASEMIQVPPSACTVFEDSISGITAATNAKVKQIMVIATEGDKQHLDALPNVTLVTNNFVDPRLRTEL